ncbi:hypothetical protein Pla175_36070 [Pirellulimonas nuda]|uniref:Uncharacterized protein n=1 Tax=Pirellulimonas nuda TaxID=2528009 RepID=A0A518DFE4_9BACT|nr:hypothetical protein Pla175_36070 [Pirellulimonas nuda]
MRDTAGKMGQTVRHVSVGGPQKPKNRRHLLDRLPVGNLE